MPSYYGYTQVFVKCDLITEPYIMGKDGSRAELNIIQSVNGKAISQSVAELTPTQSVSPTRLCARPPTVTKGFLRLHLTDVAPIIEIHYLLLRILENLAIRCVLPEF